MTSTGAGPEWTPGARLAGFIKRTTIHCCKHNIKVLGLVVSEKIFLFFSHCKSVGANDPGWDYFRSQGHDSRDLCKAPGNIAAYQI